MTLLLLLGVGAHWSMHYFLLNDTAPTEIYTLTHDDALPFDQRHGTVGNSASSDMDRLEFLLGLLSFCLGLDNQKTEEPRLNSSHPSRSRMPSSA